MKCDNETIVRQIQTGQGNRNELLERLWTENLGLIRKIIHRLTGLQYGYAPDREDFEDLEQQAFIGIMEAIQHYDSTRGKRFFTFAQYYIRKAVYRYYDKSYQLIRMPAYMRKHVRDYLREKDIMRQKGEAVNDGIIREVMGLSEKAFENTLHAVRRMEIQRLDSYIYDGGRESATLLDMVAGDGDTGRTAMESVYHAELKALLRSALQELPEMERNVLNIRHFQRMNVHQASIIMDCSPQYVSQLAKKAYRSIRLGKYGRELSTFLPERASHRAEKHIRNEFKELGEQEKGFLI